MTDSNIIPFRTQRRHEPRTPKRYSILVKEGGCGVSELCQVDTHPEAIADAARRDPRYHGFCIIDHQVPYVEWNAYQLNLVLQCGGGAQWAADIRWEIITSISWRHAGGGAPEPEGAA